MDECGTHSQLLRRGDFERAMEHFLLAGTDLVAVLALFPDFLPAQLRPRLSGLLQLAAGSQRQQPALVSLQGSLLAVAMSRSRAPVTVC